MKFIVTERNNFCRVFRIPIEFPSGYCFGGGYPVQFQLVDWFNPVPPQDDCPFHTYPIELEGDKLESHQQQLREWVDQKSYRKKFPLNAHVILTDYGDAILV